MTAPLGDWVAGVREAYTCSVNPIPFSQSKEWVFRDGALCHQTGRFFSIRTFLRDGEAARPMIDQPEIGILGFALRPAGSGGLEILCHAKAEPRNARVIQVAPSFQATRSNFEQLHGGARQILHDWFVEPGRGEVTASSLQTETSEFFFRKRNRNVVRLLPAGCGDERSPLPSFLKWFPLASALAQIDVPFLFNTDARTVLVAADWHQLAGEARPFQTRRLDPVLGRCLRNRSEPWIRPATFRGAAWRNGSCD